MNDAELWSPGGSQAVVIDTNIVLDLYLFHDPAQKALEDALRLGRVQWLATAAMQKELAYVLARESTHHQAQKKGVSPNTVAVAMAERVRWMERAPVCTFRCKDPTDQGFVDLAVAHRALLISKDKAVLRLATRLAPAGVGMGPTLAAARQKCLPAQSASAG